MDKIITVLLIVLAALMAYSVLTPNHLFVG